MVEYKLIKFNDSTPPMLVVIIENKIWILRKSIADLFSVDETLINEYDNYYDLNSKFINNEHFYDFQTLINIGFTINTYESFYFREFITNILQEYFIYNASIQTKQSFAEELGANYFENVYETINIENNEKEINIKIKEIFKTSYDYDSNDGKARKFFETLESRITDLYIKWYGHGIDKEETELIKQNANEKLFSLDNFSYGDVLARCFDNFQSIAKKNAFHRIPMSMEDYSVLFELSFKESTD